MHTAADSFLGCLYISPPTEEGKWDIFMHTESTRRALCKSLILTLHSLCWIHRRIRYYSISPLLHKSSLSLPWGASSSRVSLASTYVRVSLCVEQVCRCVCVCMRVTRLIINKRRQIGFVTLWHCGTRLERRFPMQIRPCC